MFQKFQNLWQGARSVDEYVTEFFMLMNHVETNDTDLHLVTHFVGGLRQQIQYTMNFFRPLSISEAHQQDITVKAQLRSGGASWSRTIRFNSVPSSSVLTDATAPKTETPLISDDSTRGPRPGGFRFFFVENMVIGNRLFPRAIVMACCLTN